MVIHNSLKMGLHKCPSTDEWVSTVLCIYRMEYYLAIKKNEIIKFSGKWTDLEKIMLREVRRFRMTNTCTFSFVCGFWLQILRCENITQSNHINQERTKRQAWALLEGGQQGFAPQQSGWLQKICRVWLLLASHLTM